MIEEELPGEIVAGHPIEDTEKVIAFVDKFFDTTNYNESKGSK